MDKLVKLLNKFEKEKIINEGGYVDEDDEYFGRSIEDGDIVNWSYDPDAHGFMKYYIISKDFKFIERLVKNDKIDLDMAREKLGIPCCVWYGSGRIIAVKDVEDYGQVLMLLAI